MAAGSVDGGRGGVVSADGRLLAWMLVYGLVEGTAGKVGTSIMKWAWHATMSSPSSM